MRALDDDQRLAGFVLLVMAALSLAMRFVTPVMMPWLPPCPFYQLTGLYCPGCGATRALYLLVHAHPLLALHENALVMLALPLVLAGLVGKLMGQGIVISPRLAPTLRTVIVIGVIVFAVARNLPCEPFQRLAPLPAAQLTNSLR